MTRVGRFLPLFLALGWPGLAWTQVDDQYPSGSEDEYFNTFGDEGQEYTAGPQTIAEAKRTGRGYRIGEAGVHRRTVPDVYTIQKGDTLWDITERFYGNPWHWPRVWSYNPEISNPHWIYPSDQIRLVSPADLAQGAGAPGEELRAERAPLRVFQPGTVFLRDQGYLDDEALQTVGKIIGAKEEHMLLSPADDVYVKFRPGQPVRVGGRYTVFRTMRKMERDPAERGVLVRIFGTIVVRDYDPKTNVARAMVEEALDPIERGYKVAYMERRFNFVPAKPNRNDVMAKIIASIRPRSLLAANNVVFLNVGRDKGIEPGNRFFVLRQGDDWRQSLRSSPRHMGPSIPVPPYELSDYPHEAVAELRVVKVRNKTTIALVTSSDTDVHVGDRAVMQRGF